MLFSEYKEEKNIFKIIAKQEGISVAEVHKEMKFAIEDAYNTDNPDTKKEFQKCLERKNLHQKNLFVRCQKS